MVTGRDAPCAHPLRSPSLCGDFGRGGFPFTDPAGVGIRPGESPRPGGNFGNLKFEVLNFKLFKVEGKLKTPGYLVAACY